MSNHSESAEPVTAEAQSSTPANPRVIPEELARELRTLSHDLSNSLEIIVQTSYLLSLAELKEPATEWLQMLEGGVTKALELNTSMRNFLREHSSK